jgi:hypothetical protein
MKLLLLRHFEAHFCWCLWALNFYGLWVCLEPFLFCMTKILRFLLSPFIRSSLRPLSWGYGSNLGNSFDSCNPLRFIGVVIIYRFIIVDFGRDLLFGHFFANELVELWPKILRAFEVQIFYSKLTLCIEAFCLLNLVNTFSPFSCFLFSSQENLKKEFNLNRFIFSDSWLNFRFWEEGLSRWLTSLCSFLIQIELQGNLWINISDSQPTSCH